jgi:xylulose-5-phosphate/fructose-6-phosphate phosphoketolase
MTYHFDAAVSSAVPGAAVPQADPPDGPLTPGQLQLMQLYWQAANYLTIGQIYLQANPLLREPLHIEQIKPRLLGHWGTSPGLSFIYVHLNRLIKERDANVLFMAGPGHGGPAVVANVYLEGTYTEVYPEVSRDRPGLTRLFRQFHTRRHTQPREYRHPWLHTRRRRAGLCPLACLRGCFRQP